MKNIIAIVVLVFAFTFTAQAQKKRGGKPSAEKMLTKITKDLNLTEDQQSKIKPLLEAQIADRLAMNENRKASKEAGKKPSKEERKQQKEDKKAKENAFNTEMANILNDEQFVKFEEMAKAKKEKGKDRMKKKKQ